MFKIKIHKYFQQDLTKLKEYINLISKNKSLSKNAKDKNSKGDLPSYKEFHLSGDLLVIYKVLDNDLLLLRIGSHSKLFK